MTLTNPYRIGDESFHKDSSEKAASSVCPFNVPTHLRKSRLRRNDPQGVALLLLRYRAMAGVKHAMLAQLGDCAFGSFISQIHGVSIEFGEIERNVRYFSINETVVVTDPFC